MSCVTLSSFLLFYFRTTEIHSHQQVLRNIGYWKEVSAHPSKALPPHEGNKGMIHMKSVLFLHCTVCTSLELLAVA